MLRKYLFSLCAIGLYLSLCWGAHLGFVWLGLLNRTFLGLCSTVTFITAVLGGAGWLAGKLTDLNVIWAALNRIWRPFLQGITKVTDVDRRPVTLPELEGIVGKIDADPNRLSRDDLYQDLLHPGVIVMASPGEDLTHKHLSWPLFSAANFIASCRPHTKTNLVSLFVDRYKQTKFRGLLVVSDTRSHDLRLFLDCQAVIHPLLQSAKKGMITTDNTLNQASLQRLIADYFIGLTQDDDIVIVQIFAHDEANEALLKTCNEVRAKGYNVVGLFAFFGYVEKELQFRNIKREILVELKL